MQVRYTGHVGTGGLQGHSIGANYPYTIIGVQLEGDDHTYYRVFHCTEGQATPRNYRHAADAQDVIDFLKSLNT